MSYPWTAGDVLAAADLDAAFAERLLSAGGDVSGNLIATGAGAWKVPVGTTLQRPNTGDVGSIRYNTTTARTEFGTGGAWRNHVRLDGDTMTGALNITGALNVTGAITSTLTNFIQAGSNVSLNNVIREVPAAATFTPSIQVLGPDTNIGLTVVLKGTGVLTVPRVTLGTTQTLSGTFAASQAPIFLQSSISGSVTDTYRNLNHILVQSDNVATSGNAVQAMTVTHNYGGAAMTKGRIAFTANLLQTAATQNTTSMFYQAGQFTTTCNYPEPGSTAPTLAGSVGIPFALGVTAMLGSGATNYSGIAGTEMDIIVGAQPFSVLGMSVVRLTGGLGTVYQAAEPSLDTAFKIGNGCGLLTWINGYTITSPSAQWALDATRGAAFKLFDGASYDTLPSVAAYGIHLQACQFTTAAFLSQGALIDGTGVASFKGANLGGWTATVATTGLTIAPTNQIGLSAVVAAGGTGYHVNEKISFATNGLLKVTTVAAGVVTAFTILQAPTSAAPPANPLATTSTQITGAGQAAGSGLTLTVTWSASDALTLGSAAGKHGFYGAAGVVKPTGVAITAAGIHAALVSLNLIAP